MAKEILVKHALATAAEVSSYIADLACDAGVEKFKDHCDQSKLHKSVIEFIERHRKYHELGTLAEEFDFEGLLEYLKGDFVETVQRRCFVANKKERGKARDELENAAIVYAKANCPEAIDKVSRFVDISIDIIREFYKKRIDVSQWILADSIIDELDESIKDSEKSIKFDNKKNTDSVLEAVEKNAADRISWEEQATKKLAEIQASVNSSGSLDHIAVLAKTYKYDEMNELFGDALKTASSRHELFPYYGVDWRNGRLVSVPLRKEATEKYPPRFVCKGFGTVGGRKITNLNPSVIDYANRHQLKIILTTTEVEKYLGERRDPFSGEANTMVGSSFVIEPKPFPPAFPCSISVDDAVYYDYIELRTKEIMDDGTYVVTNDEQQNTNIHIELYFNLNDSHKRVTYTMSVKDGSYLDMLGYARMMRAASKGGFIEIKDLKRGEPFMAGKLDKFECQTGFTSIDEEIDFLERICDIEKYYSVDISVPDSFKEDEIFPIKYVSELIRGGTNEFPLGEVTFSGTLDDDLRKIINTSDNESEDFVVSAEATIDIWGTSIKLNICRTYKAVKLKDAEKLKKKLEVLDNGDPVNVTYVSGGEHVFVDRLLTEELEKLFPITTDK